MRSAWVLFSTSSPQAGVAFYSSDGECLYSNEAFTPMASGGFCIEEYQNGLARLGDIAVRGLIADCGPGSFTGTRVAVMLAKTFGWYLGVQVAGVSAFDLISPEESVTIPNRKGEAFLRVPSHAPILVKEIPAGVKGYGPMIDLQEFPSVRAYKFDPDEMNWMEPELLVPAYLVQPSISTSKKPMRSPRV